MDKSMKLVLEILISVLLHPIAMILMFINIIGRTDLDGVQKVAWALAGLLWGLGPILYILAAEGDLW
jgi:hypothetical protein